EHRGIDRYGKDEPREPARDEPKPISCELQVGAIAQRASRGIADHRRRNAVEPLRSEHVDVSRCVRSRLESGIEGEIPFEGAGDEPWVRKSVDERLGQRWRRGATSRATLKEQARRESQEENSFHGCEKA